MLCNIHRISLLLTGLLAIGCGGEEPEPGFAQCEFQCAVATECVDFVLEHGDFDTGDVEGERDRTATLDQLQIDQAACVERCEFIESSARAEYVIPIALPIPDVPSIPIATVPITIRAPSTYRTCAREAWGALHLQSDTGGPDGGYSEQTIVDIGSACTRYLQGECDQVIHRDEDPAGCATSGAGHLPAGVLIFIGLIAARRRRLAGAVGLIGLFSLMGTSKPAHALESAIELGSGNQQEIGAGAGYMAPMARQSTSTWAPIYGALKPTNTRIQPGPYLQTALSLDSNLIRGDGGGGGRFGLGFSYLTNFVTDQIIEEAEAEDAVENLTQKVKDNRLVGALRVRAGDLGYFTSRFLYGATAGTRSTAYRVKGLELPYTANLAGPGRSSWAGQHFRYDLGFRTGFYASEYIHFFGLQMARERPYVIELGASYEQLVVPAFDITRTDNVTKTGGYLDLSSDPALHLESKNPVDYFLHFRFGYGKMEFQEVTFDDADAQTAADSRSYIDSTVGFGLTGFIKKTRRSQIYLRLSHDVDLTQSKTEKFAYGFSGARSILSVGHLH